MPVPKAKRDQVIPYHLLVGDTEPVRDRTLLQGQHLAAPQFNGTVKRCFQSLFPGQLPEP